MIMKLLFLTTSTLSDIQEVQSKCIKKFFPNSQHIIIDGRFGWFLIWYEWLNVAKNIDSDWYIYVDEDCFITSNKEILNHIEYMQKNNIDISGCPDGFHEYRSGNNIALNSFFMIMNKKCIDSWHSRDTIPQFKKEWIEDYPYVKTNTSRYIFDMEFGSSGKPFQLIYKDGSEPYYDFMWVLKDKGLKFFYLEPKFGSEYKTTNLLNDTVMHMWHQRERWSNNIVSTLHDIPNKIRYDNMIEYLIKNRGISRNF